MPRGRNGRETEFSTKNTFLKMSPRQQGKNLSYELMLSPKKAILSIKNVLGFLH